MMAHVTLGMERRIAESLEQYAKEIRAGEWPFAHIDIGLGIKNVTKPTDEHRHVEDDGTRLLTLRVGKSFLPGSTLDDGRSVK